jgi:hypothetical protein
MRQILPAGGGESLRGGKRLNHAKLEFAWLVYLPYNKEKYCMEVTMAVHNTQEERQLIKLIDEMPMTDEVKQGWVESIRSEGLNEELAEEIRQKLTSHPEADTNFPNRARCMAQLSNITRRWRLTSQKQIGKRR